MEDESGKFSVDQLRRVLPHQTANRTLKLMQTGINPGNKREWNTKKRTKEEIEALMEELELQIEVFELEVLYEKKLIEYRDLFIKWHEGRITLDEILRDRMKRGCGKNLGRWLEEDKE